MISTRLPRHPGDSASVLVRLAAPVPPAYAPRAEGRRRGARRVRARRGRAERGAAGRGAAVLVLIGCSSTSSSVLGRSLVRPLVRPWSGPDRSSADRGRAVRAGAPDRAAPLSSGPLGSSEPLGPGADDRDQRGHRGR